MTKPIKDPKYSRPFDVHVWSEHPEVNNFIDQVYALLPAEVIGRVESKSNNKGTLPKHLLKVVLMDLFVAWKQDPELCIGISLANAAYKVGSRYNGLHLSKKLPIIVHALRELGLLDWENHSHSKTNPKGNRTTRIRASDQLQELFKEAPLREQLVQFNTNKETIVLRDIDEDDPGVQAYKKSKSKGAKGVVEMEYDDDELPLYLHTARDDLAAYNALLNRSHIDIGILEEPNYSYTKREKSGVENEVTMFLHQGRHHVRRIFSRGSFHLNGRFNGGWWQQCPKKLRRHIFINRQQTAEIDYSGLHPRILAAEKGYELSGDPYEVPSLKAYEFDSDTQRMLMKGFVLVAINAADATQAYGAFRSGNQNKFSFPLTKKLFEALWSAFEEAHPPLAECLFSDQGIRLMNVDSRIAAEVINEFVSLNEPILTLHDSFLVRVRKLDLLEDAMASASEKVVGRKLNFGLDRMLTSLDQVLKFDESLKRSALEGYLKDYAFFPAYDQRWREWKGAQALH